MRARLGFRGTEQNTSGGDAPKPFLSHGRSAIMESVSGFSSCFPPRNLEGSLSPESGTGCIGLSTALSEQPPRGTDRRDRSIALSRRPPRRTHSQRPKRFPLRPLGHPSRGVPFAPAGSSRLPGLPKGISSLSSRVRLVAGCAIGNGGTVHGRKRHRTSSS